MNKYRIGYIEGSWINFTPPIRGGIYRDAKDIDTDIEDDFTAADTDDENDTDWSSCVPSWNSSRTSLSLDVDEDPKNRSDHTSFPYINTLKQSSSLLAPPEETSRPRLRKTLLRQGEDTIAITPSQPSLLTSPEEYTASILQEEVETSVRDNPSLDAQTQGHIAAKYQALHQRVKTEGYYDCQYTEYMKEVVRYTFLFGCFFVCLRKEWYMTSAVFLGLFWVSLPSQQGCNR